MFGWIMSQTPPRHIVAEGFRRFDRLGAKVGFQDVNTVVVAGGSAHRPAQKTGAGHDGHRCSQSHWRDPRWPRRAGMGFSSGPIQTNAQGECSRNGTLGRGEGHISARGPQAWMLQEGLLKTRSIGFLQPPLQGSGQQKHGFLIGTAFGMTLLCSTMVDALCTSLGGHHPPAFEIHAWRLEDVPRPCAWWNERFVRTPEASGPPHRRVVHLDTEGARRAAVGRSTPKGMVESSRSPDRGLWGLEGPIIEFRCSAYGPAKLPSSIDGGGPRDQRQPRAH